MSLAGAIEAARLGLIRPVLVGPEARIRQVAAEASIDLGGIEIVGARHSHEAGEKAVGLVSAGRAEPLMKGSPHTDELMAPVAAREGGIRTARRISHCFVMDVPGRADPLIITDAAVNIAPTLEEKVDIVQNAIDLAHAMHFPEVRVAILSAMELVNPRLRSTIEAAAPCKMAERGQITGALLDGPLALDTAIDMAAASVKHIVSAVAGRANVLVVPDLEAGNMLAKSLSFLAGADAAGIVLGARVPIILTSRADSLQSRLASCAVASLLVASRGGTRRRPCDDGPRGASGPGRAGPAMTAPGALFVLNAGSSSIKFALYRHHAGPDRPEPVPLFHGQIERIASAPRLAIVDAAGASLAAHECGGATFDHHDATAEILRVATGLLRGLPVLAVGHREVHGGMEFASPVRIDAAVLEKLAALIPLAPLHQPHNLAPIRAIARQAPQLAQAACFDTFFHHGQAPVAQAFALPRRFAGQGVRRYGFHGLSCEYLAGRLRALAPDLAARRLVIAHQGNGASLCAAHQGKSVATTMGFTALDGLVMGTRCGSIDPGVILYMMDRHGMDARAIEDLLYRGSGLLGVSGIASDMRSLRASAAPAAAEAIALFVYRIVREVGSLAAALGGLDRLVFSAGIGEHDAATRREVAQGCAWLGLALDPVRNEAGAGRISADGSAVQAWVVPTDEERMIARHTVGVLGLDG